MEGGGESWDVARRSRVNPSSEREHKKVIQKSTNFLLLKHVKEQKKETHTHKHTCVSVCVCVCGCTIT